MVKIYLAPNPRLVWALVSLTYISVMLQMLLDLRGVPAVAALSLTFALVSTGFTFKLAFAAEDAPELVQGLARSLNDAVAGSSLITRARLVFLLLAMLAAVAVYQRQTSDRQVMPSGDSPFTHTLCSMRLISLRGLTGAASATSSASVLHLGNDAVTRDKHSLDSPGLGHALLSWAR